MQSSRSLLLLKLLRLIHKSSVYISTIFRIWPTATLSDFTLVALQLYTVVAVILSEWQRRRITVKKNTGWP